MSDGLSPFTSAIWQFQGWTCELVINCQGSQLADRQCGDTTTWLERLENGHSIKTSVSFDSAEAGRERKCVREDSPPESSADLAMLCLQCIKQVFLAAVVSREATNLFAIVDTVGAWEAASLVTAHSWRRAVGCECAGVCVNQWCGSGEDEVIPRPHASSPVQAHNWLVAHLGARLCSTPLLPTTPLTILPAYLSVSAKTGTAALTRVLRR